MKPLVIIVAISFICLVSPAQAQNYDTSPSAQTGRLPIGSYNSVELDNVSVFNGNLSLDIPLLEVPGRELSTGLHLTYNSQKCDFDTLIWPTLML